jgi:hypothetical protein
MRALFVVLQDNAVQGPRAAVAPVLQQHGSLVRIN